MMTILDIRYWRLAVFTASACIATVLSGCAGEGDEPVPSPVEGEVAEVPVTITFGTAWEQDGATRVPPPGQEADPDKIDGWYETDADKVRIVTFRRKDMDNQLQGGAVNDAPFTYDPTNDYVVDCVKGNHGENRRRAESFYHQRRGRHDFRRFQGNCQNRRYLVVYL